MAVSLYLPHDVAGEIQARFKALRLDQNLTQQGLALRSGVSLGSVKRFESTGEISFDSLLRLAMALGRIEDFYRFARSLTPPERLSLDDLPPPVRPKRGRRT